MQSKFNKWIKIEFHEMLIIVQNKFKIQEKISHKLKTNYKYEWSELE